MNRLFFVLLFMITFIFCGTNILLEAGDEELVKIYRLDGTVQCGTGKEEITLDEMAEQYKKIGGEIINQEKRKVPYYIPTVCGAPTGNANVYTVTKNNWELILRGIVGPIGFSLWEFDTVTLFVYKYDGTLQCGMGEEVTLAEMEKELKQNNINVYSKRKGHDGLFHSDVCGASTGLINVFEIDGKSFKKAEEIGYRYLTNKFSTPASFKTGGDWPVPMIIIGSGGTFPVEVRGPGTFPFKFWPYKVDW